MKISLTNNFPFAILNFGWSPWVDFWRLPWNNYYRLFLI